MREIGRGEYGGLMFSVLILKKDSLDTSQLEDESDVKVHVGYPRSSPCSGLISILIHLVIKLDLSFIVIYQLLSQTVQS